MSSTMKGVVVSNQMQKTVVVQIVRKVKHKLYGKYINKHHKVHAHYEGQDNIEGKRVILKPSKPYSKNKSWVVSSLIEF